MEKDSINTNDQESNGINPKRMGIVSDMDSAKEQSVSQNDETSDVEKTDDPQSTTAPKTAPESTTLAQEKNEEDPEVPLPIKDVMPADPRKEVKKPAMTKGKAAAIAGAAVLGTGAVATAVFMTPSTEANSLPEAIPADDLIDINPDQKTPVDNSSATVTAATAGSATATATAAPNMTAAPHATQAPQTTPQSALGPMPSAEGSELYESPEDSPEDFIYVDEDANTDTPIVLDEYGNSADAGIVNSDFEYYTPTPDDIDMDPDYSADDGADFIDSPDTGDFMA